MHNVARNQRNTRTFGKISGKETIGKLSSDKLNDLANAFKRNEGWIPGSITRQ